jgi:GNAT superfamily N-acetyltransferase
MAATLARAFADDPLISWWLPDARTRQRRAARLFAVGFEKINLPHHEVYTTDDHAGAAVWAPPNSWNLSLRATLPALPATVLTLRSGLGRYLRAMATLGGQHPREPHWYLEGIGTDPPKQRRGVGAALIAPGLAHCDRDGVPAFLETQKETNVPYYRRFGFEVSGELDVPGGGPHLWQMWREPRQSQ